MEVTGRKVDQVHVFKQAFRPNEPFRAALEKIVIAGSGESRPFSIFGSDQRVVETSDVYTGEFNMQQLEANKFMASKNNVHLGIESGIKGRVFKSVHTGASVLQLVMQPANRAEYTRVLEGLDMVHLGTRGHALGFEALQLYMNIPFQQLAPIRYAKDRLADINGVLEADARHNLYQITPQPYLVSTIVPRAQVTPKPGPDAGPS